MTPADIRREADELERFINAPPKAVAALRALADVVEAGKALHDRAERDGRIRDRAYSTEEVRLIAALDLVEQLKP